MIDDSWQVGKEQGMVSDEGRKSSMPNAQYSMFKEKKKEKSKTKKHSHTGVLLFI